MDSIIKSSTGKYLPLIGFQGRSVTLEFLPWAERVELPHTPGDGEEGGSHIPGLRNTASGALKCSPGSLFAGYAEHCEKEGGTYCSIVFICIIAL